MKSVIFIAPPAAGKGTQSDILKKDGYIHLSTGDMLRREVSSGSELGVYINNLMQSGALVNDDIVNELIVNNLSALGNKPFILDGYPRNLAQAENLSNIFDNLNISNYEVIYLKLSENDALKRTLGRVTCKCGKSYNLNEESLKPRIAGVCDDCGSELVTRNDDNPESFKVRFETYINNATPLIQYYEKLNKLHEIDALNNSFAISEEIKGILK